MMKPTAARIERMLEKIEATQVPPSRQWLQIITHEGDAEAVVKEKQEKALAEHVARHPEDAGRTVEDFKWIVHEFVQWPPGRNLTIDNELPADDEPDDVRHGNGKDGAN
jgi:hypothetical protein